MTLEPTGAGLWQWSHTRTDRGRVLTGAGLWQWNDTRSDRYMIITMESLNKSYTPLNIIFIFWPSERVDNTCVLCVDSLCVTRLGWWCLRTGSSGRTTPAAVSTSATSSSATTCQSSATMSSSPSPSPSTTLPSSPPVSVLRTSSVTADKPWLLWNRLLMLVLQEAESSYTSENTWQTGAPFWCLL